VVSTRFNDVAYERFLGDRKLMGCRCKACGARYIPPNPLCSACYSTDLEWIEYGGEGHLAAFTCIRVVPPLMQSWGYSRETPYCTGVVELAEGGRVVAVIDEIDATRPETIKIGMPLTVKYLTKRSGETVSTILAFKPA
jgi:scaffold protein (connect acetoacetyl-CoA thiolase and HMG-CoA synthase)